MTANTPSKPLSAPVKAAGKKGRRILIAAVCILLAAGISTAVFLNRTQQTSAQTGTVYREYSVQYGDISIGTEESGTAAVEREYVTFPLSATVKEILVKVGQVVTAGTPLVQLDVSSITDVTAEYETKIADAKKTLDDAIYNQTTGLIAAKQKYESDLLAGESAPIENELSKTQLDYDIATAQSSLQKLREQLAAYKELSETDDADKAKLDELEAKIEEKQESVDKYQEQLDYYNKINADFLTAANTTLKTDSTNTAALATVATITAEQKSLQSVIDSYTEEVEAATEAYNEFKEYFNETYGELYGDALGEKIETLTASIESAQLALDKKTKTYTSTLAEADQQLESQLSSSSLAQTTYNNTVNKLASAVASAQKSYDALVEEYAEIQQSITADGILTAPCDSVVATIGYTDGSKYNADQTLIALADKRFISMSVSISEEDITSIAVGQEAQVSFTAYEGQTFDAVVDSVAYEPARSSSAVTYTVTIKLEDESGTLNIYEGMSGEVTILQKQVVDTLYVSNQAITFANGKSTVLMKNTDGTQSAVEVTTGFSDGRYVQILSGLKQGDTVLVESAVSAK